MSRRISSFPASLASVLLLTTFPACTTPGGDGDGDASAGETCGALFCSEGESGDGDGDGDGDGEASTGDGDGDGDGDGSCTDDDQCPETQICNTALGQCVPDCGKAEVVLSPPPPPVMLVLDKSGSMVSNSWDHDANPGTPDETRWATLFTVTEFILNNFDNSIAFGMQLFPSVAACPNANCYNADACTVSGAPEVGIADMNGSAILAAMPAASSGSSVIKGGTPASDGIRNAVTAIQSQTIPDGVTPAIILVTDGAANCGQGQVCENLTNCPLLEEYDSELPTLVGDAFTNDGIPTYVVGIDIIDQQLGTIVGDGTPDANPHTELNAVAVAGGVPQTGGADSFYNATNQAELQAALELIANDLVDCEVDLTEPPNMAVPPAQIPFVEFIIGGSMVPGPLPGVTEQDCIDGTDDGWIWINEGSVLRFCGSYCEDLKMTGEVDGIYNCPPAG